MQVEFTQQRTLPDPTRLERYARTPDIGPRILFFSGGSALQGLCRELVTYTHNSIHIITPFDSGGSSAVLRKKFDMPAIGDIRSRLMALADRSMRGNPQIRALFSHRLPKNRSQGALEREIHEMIFGDHPLIQIIPCPMQTIIQRYIRRFYDNMDRFFDLRGANIGNLVLTGGFLANDRDLESILFVVSNLIKVRGHVTALVDDNLHLGARLVDGSVILGQHALTGKEVPPITAPIADMFLCPGLDQPQAVSCTLSRRVKHLIQSADLICFPMGSFYTSLLANLLPQGVGKAIAAATCPKIYIPSTGTDPECLGMSVADQVRTLIRYLCKDDPATISPRDVLNFVLVHEDPKAYPGGLDLAPLENMPPHILSTNLVNPARGSSIHGATLARILVSMA
jgi:CofD-related protein of GAK system